MFQFKLIVFHFSHGYQDNGQPKPVTVSKIKPIPMKPSPSRLYFDSRLEELLVLGKSEKDIFSMTCDIDNEYQMLPDEQKIKWIQLALEKAPAYMVLFYLYVNI